MPAAITIGAEVWIATALLHREHPEREDFTIREIKERVEKEGIAGTLRAGLETHIRQMCVANRRRDPSRDRLLYATETRTRRLFRDGDPYEVGREGGKFVPARDAMPERYRYLVDWYFSEYAGSGRKSEKADPILALRGLGKEIWRDEHPDAYVQRLRQGWE